MWSILAILVLDLVRIDGLESGAMKEIHWAVLVAGSNGWENYRHQADLCHAYQLLLNRGLKPQNIITMMYDDVASNIHNRFPGKIFNDYKHKDVYRGVRIDYRGKDVTPQMFLRVLLGDSQLKSAGKKVLESGPGDNVFIYFTDHGAPHLIAFPMDVLHANDLRATLLKLNARKRYKKLLFYMEACYSGSMFENILASNLSILAVTAANGKESSWACFCNDPKIDTCLGDDYSYRWIMDSETHTLRLWTVAQQLITLKKGVKGSHVMDYGDKNILKSRLSEFQAQSLLARFNSSNLDQALQTIATTDHVSSDRAHLIPLIRRLTSANTAQEMDMARRRLDRTSQLAKLVKETVDEIVNHVTRESVPSDQTTDMDEQLECYKTVYEQYKTKCFSIQQVPELAHELHKFDQLCKDGYNTHSVVQAIFDICG